MPVVPRPVREARKHRATVVDPHMARPMPVVALAEKLGYTVNEFTPTAETRDVSGAVNHQRKTIFINEQENARRKRFTIAHEIGHIILHADEGDIVDYRQSIGPYPEGQTPKEQEANQFAAELLMPRAVFESLWNALEGSVRDIADQLDVSTQAAEIRALQLGLA